jgi:hypothetical protein
MNTKLAMSCLVASFLLGCPEPKGDAADGAADAPAATTAAPTAEAPPDAGLAAPVDTAKPVLRVVTKDGGQDAAAATDAGAVAATDASAPAPTTEDAGAPAPSGDAGGGAGRVLPKCPPGQVRGINGRCMPAR